MILTITAQGAGHPTGALRVCCLFGPPDPPRRTYIWERSWKPGPDRQELDYPICGDPSACAEPVLKGDGKKYLDTVRQGQ